MKSRSFLRFLLVLLCLSGHVAFAEEKPAADWIRYSTEDYRMSGRDGAKWAVTNDNPHREIHLKLTFKNRNSSGYVHEQRLTLVISPGRKQELATSVRKDTFFDFKTIEARYR